MAADRPDPISQPPVVGGPRDAAIGVAMPRARGLAQPVRFVGVAYTIGALTLGTNIPSPLYQVYAERFDFSALVLTLIFSTYCAAIIPSLLLVAGYAHRVGHRATLVATVLIAIVGMALFATAQSVTWLFVARAVQGLAIGVGSGALSCALVDTAGAGEVQRASLVTGVMTVGGGGVGPVVSGLVIELLPDPLQTPHVLELVILLPALVVVATLPTHLCRQPAAASAVRPAAARGAMSGDRHTLATAATATFLSWSVIGLFLALIPNYTMQAFGGSSLLVGGVAAGAILISAAVAQVCIGALPMHRARKRGFALLITGVIGLAVSQYPPASPVLFVATVVAGAGHGMIFVYALSTINGLCATGARNRLLSVFYVALYGGVGVPVIGVGLLAVLVGLRPAVGLFTVVFAVAFAAFVIADRRRGSRATSRRASPD